MAPKGSALLLLRITVLAQRPLHAVVASLLHLHESKTTTLPTPCYEMNVISSELIRQILLFPSAMHKGDGATRLTIGIQNRLREREDRPRPNALSLSSVLSIAHLLLWRTYLTCIVLARSTRVVSQLTMKIRRISARSRLRQNFLFPKSSFTRF